MKTLEEVINIMEGVGLIDWGADALRYLKAFRDAKDTLEREKDRYAEAVKNCEVAENKYIRLYGGTSQELRNTSQITCPKCHSEFVILPEANNPLTWDELREMIGKPVWVEYTRTSGIYRITFKGWMLIGYVSEKLIRFIGVLAQYGFTGEKIEYGDKWNTYKKEHGDYECIVTDLVSGSQVERTI